MNQSIGTNHVYRGITRSLINLYKNAFNNDIETINVTEEDKTLEELLPDVDFENCICFVNGFRRYKDYKPQKNDVCTIRVFPSSLAVAGLVVALIPIGVVGIIHLGKHVFLPWLKEICTSKTKNTKTQETLPSISGGKNTPATGHTIPIILGKTLFSPFTLATGYTSISSDNDGADEYYNQLYLIGYSGITVRDIFLGKNFRLSTEDKYWENGILTSTNNDYTDNAIKNNTTIEIQQGSNEVSLYPQKIVQSDISSELSCFKDTNENVKRVIANGFSAKYPMKVAVRIQLDSLIDYDSDGTPANASVEVGVSMSLDGGKTWSAFGAGFVGGDTPTTETIENYPCTVTKITRKKTKTMRFEATKEFTYNEAKDITHNTVFIKVMRKNVKNLNKTSLQDTVYVTNITTWCYDPEKSKTSFVAQTPMLENYRNRTARLGLRIKATDDIQGTIDELNVIATSKCKIWNGTKWTDDYYETTNPSAIAYHLLTSEILRTSKYVYNKANEVQKVDEDSFGAFYEWCDEDFNFGTEDKPENLQRFSCDGVALNQQKTVDLIKQVLITGRGYLVLNGSKYAVMIDKPRENPVMVLNHQNILDFSSQKNFDNLPDGYNVEYIDAIQKYIQNTLIAVPSDKSASNPELKLENKSYSYTTNAKRAYCRAMYDLSCATLRPEAWQIKTSIDGKLIEIGNLIEVQSDVITVGVGDGAEVTDVKYTGNNVSSIVVDTPFYIEDVSKNYGVKITIANGINNPIVIKRKLKNIKTGYNAELVFDSPIGSDETIPTVGDIVSFGIYEKETTDALCFGKKDNGDGTFVLTCVPYDERIYEADSGVIPDFKADITEPCDNGTGINNNVSKSELSEAVNTTTQTIMGTVQRLYSNHIVTLYRKLENGEAPLTTAGITSNLTYNFATNSIEWENESGNNGWSLDYPTTDNPIYVTSATAFGQSSTDVIAPTEWAKPITIGKNGVNGLSMATITMYRRSLNEPAKPSYGGTYNFNTGNFIFDEVAYNTWSRSIPPLDSESNPVWECHVTALSSEATESGGQLTDHIEESEWSNPIQISSNEAMSKEEIENLIKDSIADASTPYIYATVTNLGFAVNNAGYVPINQTIETVVHVLQYNEEVDFLFGDLDDIIPEGFTYTTSGNKITITAIAESRLNPLENINIPLIFRQLKECYHYHETASYGSPIADTSVYANIYYELLTLKPEDWEDNYDKYYVSSNGVATLNTSSEWVKDTYYKQVIDTEYGYIEYENGYTTKYCPLSLIAVTGGTYKGTVDSLDDFEELDNLIIGDYVTWTGNTVASSLAQEGQFVKYCVYSYIGGENTYQWQKDTDRTHTADTIADIVKDAKNELDIAQNEQAKNYFDNLFASTLVAKKIIANEGFIDNLFSEKIEMTGNGYIKSSNFDDTHGFKIDADGSAVFNNGSFRGDVVCKSLDVENEINVGTNFKLNKKGELETVSAKLNDAIINKATIKDVLTIKGDYLATPTVNPYIKEQILRGGIRAMFLWKNGEVKYKTDNIDSVTKLDTGTYLVKFNDFTFLANCTGYSLYSDYPILEYWNVPTEAKSSGKVVKRFYKVGIVTDIEEGLNAGYKIIQNYTTTTGSWYNTPTDFNIHALVYFML